jgi:hypothetical protein
VPAALAAETEHVHGGRAIIAQAARDHQEWFWKGV